MLIAISQIQCESEPSERLLKSKLLVPTSRVPEFSRSGVGLRNCISSMSRDHTLRTASLQSPQHNALPILNAHHFYDCYIGFLLTIRI